jgi:hypothetical protein
MPSGHEVVAFLDREAARAALTWDCEGAWAVTVLAFVVDCGAAWGCTGLIVKLHQAGTVLAFVLDRLDWTDNACYIWW